MERLKKVVIAPAGGAFGMAVSNPLAANGYEVTYLFRDEEKVRAFGDTRQIDRLPGITFSRKNKFTSDPEEALRGADLLISAAPVSVLEPYYTYIQPAIEKETIVISIAKGIVKIGNDYLTPSGIIQRLDPGRKKRLAVLSGPNFADEVAAGKAFLTTIASSEKKLNEYLSGIFEFTPHCRLYFSTDRKGVELWSAFKNIYAILAGINDGQDGGESIKAGFIDRAEYEAEPLVEVMGAKKGKPARLSKADFWMTCMSKKSRNNRFGVGFAQGRSIRDLLEELGTVEGYWSTPVAWELAQKHGVEMPLLQGAYAILYEGVPIDVVKNKIFARKLRYEDGKPLRRFSLSPLRG